MSDPPTQPTEEESVVLREELARVQEAARQAFSSQPDEGDHLADAPDSARDIDSVTRQVALEQELDTLRRTLREKERLVDETAAQCQRLEDELEDQHLACDGLKQDLEREKLSLAAARSQVLRMSQKRHEIEEHYQKLLSSRHPGKGGGRTENRRRSGKTSAATQFIGGLIAGILLSAAGLGVWVKLNPLASPDSHLSGEPKALSPPAASVSAAPVDTGPVPAPDSSLVGGEERTAPVETVKVRDRLRDGTAGPSMLMVQGGEFTMGRHLALPEEDDGPAHSVRLGSFLIGATEVTFEDYDRFARATGHRLPRDFGWGRGKRPVVDVSREDARAYARWLSQRTGKRYRLPSESEWEYAASSGKSSFFWWGIEPGQGRAVCLDCGSRWDNRSSAPVASFQPNPFGLYDTAGNVMEWVEDCYHPDYVDAPADGSPWAEGSCRLGVARGGAFNTPVRSLYSTARNSFAPETRINALGFRVARDE